MSPAVVNVDSDSTASAWLARVMLPPAASPADAAMQTPELAGGAAMR